MGLQISESAPCSFQPSPVTGRSATTPCDQTRQANTQQRQSGWLRSCHRRGRETDVVQKCPNIARCVAGENEGYRGRCANENRVIHDAAAYVGTAKNEILQKEPSDRARGGADQKYPDPWMDRTEDEVRPNGERSPGRSPLLDLWIPAQEGARTLPAECNSGVRG